MTTHLHRAWGDARMSRTVRAGRTISVMFLSVFALAFIIIATVRPPSGSAAESPDEPSTIIQDFDDDGVDDTLTPDPAGEHGDYSTPGEAILKLSSGFDQETEITFRGETHGDMFGESVATAALTVDGLPDVIAGAPLAEVERADGTVEPDGAVYVFLRPFAADGDGVVAAFDAEMRLESAFSGVDDHFGLRVGPLFDVTGNGLPEIRVRALVREAHVDFIGGAELMHVFAGADSAYADAGEFLFAITVNDDFDPWAPLPGDVTGDGAVTQDDIDIILANMGLSGADLTRFDGDLNGDGVVDALDLAIALDHLGTQVFDVEWNDDGVPRPFGMDGPIPPGWRVPPGTETPPSGICFDQYGNQLCCTVCSWCPDCCCGGGQGGFGTDDPCIDKGPCDEECEDRFCDSGCEDENGEPYGACHPQCGGSECNSNCGEGVFDPCAPECEGAGFGPCSAACEDEGDGGPCSAICDERFCNADCEDEDGNAYGPCHPECDEGGGGSGGGNPCESELDLFDEEDVDPDDPDAEPVEEETPVVCLGETWTVSFPGCGDEDDDDGGDDDEPDCTFESHCYETDDDEADDAFEEFLEDCENDDGTIRWSASPASAVEWPDGQEGKTVQVTFVEPGEVTLMAREDCCAGQRKVEVECCDACDPECGEDGEGNPYGPCHEECDGYDPAECGDCEDPDPCELTWHITGTP